MGYEGKISSAHGQRKADKVRQRDDYTCKICGDTNGNMQVHHIIYLPDKLPWEYPDHLLVTLCRKCHKIIHSPNGFEKLSEKQMEHHFNIFCKLYDENIFIIEQYYKYHNNGWLG